MKIEMHAHTSEISPCGYVTAEDMISAYAGIGYGAVTVTDHFNDYVVENYPGTGREKVDRYLRGYDIACEAGEKFGVKVLLGAEVCLAGGLEDYLVYGITRDFLYDNPRMFTYTQRRLYAVADAAGALVFQAHPCRSYCRPGNPRFLHGVEVFNGNSKSHKNNNTQALSWAVSYPHLLHCSGSDFHDMPNLGRGGIVVPDEFEFSSTTELCGYIKNNRVGLVTSPED